MTGSGNAYLTHLACPRCGDRLEADRLQNVCGCGSPLLARYDLDRVRDAVTPDDIGARPSDLWRYRELLPTSDVETVTTLGEGWTPLLPARRFGERIGVNRLLIKDEGVLPTGTFKARGAAVGVSRARELGARHVAMPTNGNAGAAWAMYAARAGLSATIAIPVDAPAIARRECVAAGADVTLIDGLIGDAGRHIAGVIAASNGAIFDVSTLKEPYRLEGKKTMGLELIEQLGWRVPDVIMYPTGGGVGLIGIWKAIAELRTLGWIPEQMPRLVAVQSSGCAPIVAAFHDGADRATAWRDARTIAFGITVPAPLGDELILSALRESGGTAVAVDDAELLQDMQAFAAAEGLLLCPEGAACLSAARRLREQGWLDPDQLVVILNTGTGLKYPDLIDVGHLQVEAAPV